MLKELGLSMVILLISLGESPVFIMQQIYNSSSLIFG